jgi:hypothetical protein
MTIAIGINMVADTPVDNTVAVTFDIGITIPAYPTVFSVLHSFLIHTFYNYHQYLSL